MSEELINARDKVLDNPAFWPRVAVDGYLVTLKAMIVEAALAGDIKRWHAAYLIEFFRLKSA